jgi:hypothetical protein
MMTEKWGIGWKLGYALFLMGAVVIGLLTYRIVRIYLGRADKE